MSNYQYHKLDSLTECEREGLREKIVEQANLLAKRAAELAQAASNPEYRGYGLFNPISGIAATLAEADARLSMIERVRDNQVQLKAWEVAEANGS